MGPLELVVESVELVEAELCVNRLLLVALVEQLHLQQNRALTITLDHAVCSRY